MARELERELRKSESGAAKLRTGLEIVLASAFPTKEHSVMAAAFNTGRSALATNAGREMLAEVERLRSELAVALADERTSENLLSNAQQSINESHAQSAKLASLRAEVERLRGVETNLSIHGDLLKVQGEIIEKLRLKVKAAEGMANVFEVCPTCKGKKGFMDTTYDRTGEWVCCNTCCGTGKYASLPKMQLALTAWQEANK
jgi:hypothetical protein